MKNLAAGLGVIVTMVLLGGCNSEQASSSSSNNPPNPTPSPGTGSAVLTWEVPNRNADGSCVVDMSGYYYRVYRGPSAGNYTDSETVNLGAGSCNDSGTSNVCGPIQTCTHTASNLSSGTWYFSLQAFDANGDPSGYSNEGSKVVP